MCYLSMGMVVLLMGLVFASVYIYRYFFLAQVRLVGGGRLSEKRGRSEREVWESAAGMGASRRGQREQLEPSAWGL